MSQIVINIELCGGKDIMPEIMFKNALQKQLQHCVLPNHNMTLTDVSLLTVGSALSCLTHPNL